MANQRKKNLSDVIVIKMQRLAKQSKYKKDIKSAIDFSRYIDLPYQRVNNILNGSWKPSYLVVIQREIESIEPGTNVKIIFENEKGEEICKDE